MLTRRRAKMEGWVVQEKPQHDEIAQINVLSDLALELVFSFLDAEHIIVAAQVCTRWRNICSSRRLWTNRKVPYGFPLKAESLRVVRLLRRKHGVPPYTRVMIAQGNDPIAVFLDNGEKLVIFTPSSLMVLLCLRHLVKDDVVSLDLCVGSLLTDFESLVVWETIASKAHLIRLAILSRRGSALLTTNYKWPRQGSLCAFIMSYGSCSDDSDDDYDSDDSDAEDELSLPVRSLLEVHRHQLMRVDIEPESQQALLDVRPRSLRVLTAVVLPSLVDVVKPLKYLEALFLIYKRRGISHREQCFQVLSEILSMRKIRRTLDQLEISLAADVSTEHSEALLQLLSHFEQLQIVALRGVCRALSDPEYGPGALKTLLSGLRCARKLTVEVEPSTFPLHALLPRKVDGDSVDPLVRMPPLLAHLVLGQVKKSWLLCDAKWLQQLRRVMDAASRLHVLVQGKCLEVPRRQVTSVWTTKNGKLHVERREVRIEKMRPDYVAIYPHPCDHTCQDCRNFPDQKKGCVKMYIGDLCEPKQG